MTKESGAITITDRASASPSRMKFDCEAEASALVLAEEAAQWSRDWVDYAEMAEQALHKARIAGLKEASEVCRCPGCVDDIKARVIELEAKPDARRIAESSGG